VSTEIPFDMLFTGVNGLGIMVNPTSPYNFTLQADIVQDIAKLVEDKRNGDTLAAEEDGDIYIN